MWNQRDLKSSRDLFIRRPQQLCLVMIVLNFGCAQSLSSGDESALASSDATPTPTGIPPLNTSRAYGDYSCAEVLSCKQSCATADCDSQCDRVASQEAEVLWLDLMSCMEQSGCRDFSCAQRSCTDAYELCAEAEAVGSGSSTPSGSSQPPQSSTVTPPSGSHEEPDATDTTEEYYSGTSTCSESFWCLMECETQECADDCFYQGTVEAQQVLSSLLVCFNESTCGDEDGECLVDSCYSLVESCIPEVFEDNPVSAQGTSCAEISVCIESCGPHQQQCIEDCYYSGTLEAQQTYYDLVDCATRANCQDSACVQSHCQTQIDECQR